jgi:hypothetical protein
MTVNEVVSISFITKGLNNLGNSLKGFSKSLQTDRRTFSRDLQLSDKQLLRYNKDLGMAGVSGFKAGNKFRFMTQGLRGFRMELLSVMFFGMGMSVLFAGLLKPAMDAFGVFDLWGATLQVVFLPVVEALFPVMLSFMETLINMPESVQLAVGTFALLALVLGQALFLIGTLGLGMAGLSQMKFLTNFISDAGGMLKILSTWTASADFWNVFGKEGVLNNLSKNKLVQNISLTIGLIVSYAWLTDTSKMMTDVSTTWTTRLKNIFTGAFAGALIGFNYGGVAGAITGAIIGFSLSLVFNLFDIAWEKGWDQKMIDFFDNTKKSILNWWNNMLIDLKRGMSGQKAFSTEIKYDINGKPILTAAQEKDNRITQNIGNAIASIVNFVKGFGDFLSGNKKNDFIWRSGQGAQSINPNDNLVGFKGAPPTLGNGSGSIVVNYNISVTGSLKDEIASQIKDNNGRLVDEIKRLIGIRG